VFSTKVQLLEEKYKDNFNLISFNALNVDCGGDAIALYTESGFKIREVIDASNGSASYAGNGWRQFIIVDKNGKICYAVTYPLNGYGDPASLSYYSHPDYNDYNNNPAFKILDGYSSWVQGSYNHNLYELVIPEGGFAIVSHGKGNEILTNILSEGKITDTSNFEQMNLVNSMNAFNHDYRLAVNTTNKVIALYKEVAE
jgi:hypothetical protein